MTRAEWRVAHPDKMREYRRKWLLNNPEKQATAERNWRLAHGVVPRTPRVPAAGTRQQQDKVYAQSEKGKIVRLAAIRRYREKNRTLFASWCAKRRAARLQATPAWADLVRIQQVYRQCPGGHHVDHVIPLRGKHVSGLHVLENLQYLPALENSKKGNSYA